MNSLRRKIEDILVKENYTFSQLADYLNLSEHQLEEGLANKTLELTLLRRYFKKLKSSFIQLFQR
jgi:hypothetical protein